MLTKSIQNMHKTLLKAGIFLALGTLSANAAGELNLLTWGDITPPELVSEFESRYDVKLNIIDYDSSDTALVKARQPANGFDAAVINSSYIPIWIKEGLLMETNPSQMENFKYMRERWINTPYDPGDKYSTPYEIGFTGVGVNTSIYKGDINTSSIFLDPPPELVGKINVIPVMNEVMYFATTYVGGEPCSTDKEVMKKVRDVMVKASKSWLSINYGSVDNFARGDSSASVSWDGAIRRVTAINKDIKFGYPKEGFPVWIDAYTVLSTAKNVENAKLFQNFLMEPKIAAMVTNYTMYANSIKGSEEFLPDNTKEFADLHISAELEKSMGYNLTCSPEADAYQKAIWTLIQK